MIKVSKLVKRFDSQVVLDDINFCAPVNDILVILGESGSGKSVLLQHLIGILKPDSGSVEIDGVDITQLSERALLKVRKNIGYLFQEGALYDFMTVYENVAFPLKEHTKLRGSEIRKKVERVLELVGLLGDESKYPSELSGGMRKRAALARAVIPDSRILFCDEPTSGLDPIRSREIYDLIRSITRHVKCTTIVASHDIQNSFRIADHLILIQDGRIVAEGTPEQLSSSDNTFVKKFLR
ncbi:MAG: ABC transporter ATP-binding protein [Candidatus Omnitrophota bacterium]